MTPADKIMQYPKSSVHCTITYELAKGEQITDLTIPIDISLLGALKADSATFDPAKKFLLKRNSVGDAYSGDFYTYIDPKGAASKTAGYSITLVGYSGDSEVKWPLDPLPAVAFAIANRSVLPVNKKDDLTPDSVGGEAFTITVTVNSATDGTPIDGYIVYWKSLYTNAGLNPDYGVRAFVTGDSTHTASDQKTILVGNGQDPCIATVTDRYGNAVLTLVPTTHPVCLGLTAIYALGSTGSANAQEIEIFDPDPEITILDEPTVDLGRNGRYYDLDSEAGNSVPISIFPGKLAFGSYQYNVFLNFDQRPDPVYTIYADYKKDFQTPVVSLNLSKGLFNTTDDDGKGGRNDLFYILSNMNSGCSTSFHNIGDYTGQVADFEPDTTIQPRDLAYPSVANTTGTISLNTVANGLLLRVPVASAGAWKKPSPGDTVTATVYISGWLYGVMKKTGNVIAQSVKLSVSDINSGFVLITYDSSPFLGYGPDPEDSTSQSGLYAEFYVVESNLADTADNRIYSQYSDYVLATVL